MCATRRDMEQRRFEQAVANRRCYRVQPLGPAFAQVLAGSAAGEVDPGVLERAWRHAAPQRVWQTTRVEAFEGGALRIAVADPVTRHFLLGQRKSLCERLRQELTGLRALRFNLDENGLGKRQQG
jgi:hypothetical protein